MSFIASPFPTITKGLLAFFKTSIATLIEDGSAKTSGGSGAAGTKLRKKIERLLSNCTLHQLT